MSLDMTMTEGVAQIYEPRRRTFALSGLGATARLAALDFGDPERAIDIVFLHANGFNALTYRQMLSPLAAHLRILAVDLPGHGGSPQRVPAEGRTDWLDQCDDVQALFDQLQTGPVVMAGHSMGGCISLFAAADRPNQVSSLVLFDPVIITPQALAADANGRPRPNPLAEGAERRRAVFPSRAAVFESYRGRGAFKTWPDQALIDYIADGFVDRPDGQVELAAAPAWEASNFRAHTQDPWSAIARLRRPITVLRAEFGSTCAMTRADQLPDEIAERRVETIAGATHFLPIERPELAREALIEACASR